MCQNKELIKKSGKAVFQLSAIFSFLKMVIAFKIIKTPSVYI